MREGREGEGNECEADEEEEEMMISFLPSFHSLTDALDFPSTAQVKCRKSVIRRRWLPGVLAVSCRQQKAESRWLKTGHKLAGPAPLLPPPLLLSSSPPSASTAFWLFTPHKSSPSL
jgi:hypothetical protein